MSIAVYPVPSFRSIRSQLGAATADSATLSLANYPLSELATSGTDEMVVYWAARGAIPADTLTLQLLVFSALPEGYTVAGSLVLAPTTLGVFQVFGGSFAVRIASVSVSAASYVQIFAGAIFASPVFGESPHPLFGPLRPNPEPPPNGGNPPPPDHPKVNPPIGPTGPGPGAPPTPGVPMGDGTCACSCMSRGRDGQPDHLYFCYVPCGQPCDCCLGSV
jgi:hypothetical protein